MRTLVFGVIYPGVEHYLDDYFNSIYNQTTNDFDLLIIEDGIELPQKYLKDYTIKKTVTNSAPAEIREHGINYAKENGYDLLVFTDTDDYFSPNRIENCILNMNGNDFLVNEIVSVDNEGKELGKIVIPRNIKFSQILDGNFFGLSNTAILTRSLPEDLYIPKDIIAVDWWLFSLLLLNESKYEVDETSMTFYRQHSGNTSGYYNYITIEKIRFGINIKLTHYTHLSQYILKNSLSEFTKLIDEKIDAFNKLKIAMEDDILAKNYCQNIKQNYNEIKNGWWSEIITLSEMEKL